MKFSVYTVWADYTFYVYVAVFLISAAGFLYALRKLLAFSKEEETVVEDTESVSQQESLSDEQKDLLEGVDPVKESPQPSSAAAAQPELFEEKKANSSSLSPAEMFIKNIGDSLSSINERLSRLESSQPARNPEKDRKAVNEFALKFLEDIISDYDSLDKEKIKARLQFLISDLKK
ncbi:MAG: hypothetical protein Fur0012_07910 [Elusimicrobiota bacterium]